MDQGRYCNSLSSYSRLETTKVLVGKIPLGSGYPIRIQSMTNTDTRDVEATIAQCIRIAEAGADFVRITTPSVKDVEYLKQIRDSLRKRGHSFPLVADIHFNPQVAELASPLVEKIRINPGNYADRKKTSKAAYTDDEYRTALERIRDRFIPLLDICKKHHTAIRIGVNHGSLSERIINRYGDTPAGMAESAMEFLRICSEESFDQVVVSMKASNTIIMVQATRLLVHQMLKENLVYPVHLGVTEAGEGEDGRIKSAVGIGALLADGIGDTIRVSLTEEPENEIPVAIRLVKNLHENIACQPPESDDDARVTNGSPVNPFEYNRRKTSTVNHVGGHNVPVVVSELLHDDVSMEDLIQIGWIFDENENRWKCTDQAADLLYVRQHYSNISYPADKGVLVDYDVWLSIQNKPAGIYPILTPAEYLDLAEKLTLPHFVLAKYSDYVSDLIPVLKKDPAVILILEADNATGFHGQRTFIFTLMNQQCHVPVILKRTYNEQDIESFQLKSAADLGGLFIDGLGDGIWLSNANNTGARKICLTAFGILQASRSRISSVEYISCPSCGRTNFNIIEVSAKIRERTSHLKGLKIGIMGCVVNGIGEMADADYGYVGSGKGRVNLYKAREIIKKNVPEAEAVEELIRVIKEHGDWQEGRQVKSRV